jgi:hypothetical protein
MRIVKRPVLSAPGGAKVTHDTQAASQEATYMMHFILFSHLHTSRSFDSAGRPYPIYDDDLDEIFSRSDFAKGASQ